jgi:hypothetical protein
VQYRWAGQPKESTLFIAVPILVLWYTVHAVLSRFAGTCTMGDTDRFVAGASVGLPAAAIAVLLVLFGPARAGWRMGGVLLAVPLAMVVLYVWVPLALSAGILGHHLCGADFDSYLVAMRGWERFIPLAHVAAAAGLLFGCLKSARRARGAAQPAVAADGSSPRC